jgi:hypothetical protein
VVIAACGTATEMTGTVASNHSSRLAFATCMRAHAVPNYPAPSIPSHGPYDFGPPPGINTNAPAFRHAAGTWG